MDIYGDMLNKGYIFKEKLFMKLYVVCRKNCLIDTNYVEKTFQNLYEDIPPVAGKFLGPVKDLDTAEDLRKVFEDTYADTAVYVLKNDFWWRMEMQPNGAWKVLLPMN